MPNRLNPLWHKWQDKLRVESWRVLHSDPGEYGELSEVQVSDLLSAAIPWVQVAKFHSQKSSLQFVQPRVETFILVVIFLLGAVVAEHADTVRQFRIIGCHRAAIAECAEVFARIKAIPRGVAE